MQESSSAAPSRPQLIPYEPAHVLAGKARATKRKVEAEPLDELLIGNFASGKSSGTKVSLASYGIFLGGPISSNIVH